MIAARAPARSLPGDPASAEGFGALAAHLSAAAELMAAHAPWSWLTLAALGGLLALWALGASLGKRRGGRAADPSARRARRLAVYDAVRAHLSHIAETGGFDDARAAAFKDAVAEAERVFPKRIWLWLNEVAAQTSMRDARRGDTLRHAAGRLLNDAVRVFRPYLRG